MKITTPATLEADLRASLQQRGITVKTWGQFVGAVEALGVRETDPLGAIEFGISLHGTGRVTVYWEQGEWLIQEVNANGNQ